MAEAESTAGRTLLGLCIAMGASLTVAASFNYMLTPMLTDLGLTNEQASVALTIPSIASLLIVFLAGRLGDRRGHRTVITWMSILFIIGSAMVVVTQGLGLLVVGLLVEGVAATAIQIVVFGLLSDQFAEPAARARAFGTFGMVSPFTWMLFPVVTGAVVLNHSWRLVPVVWVLAGVLIFIAARTLLPPAREVRPVGDKRTPVLAGLTVVCFVQALQQFGHSHAISPAVLVFAGIGILSALALMLLLRRLAAPSFTLKPLRQRRARLLLVVVIIIPLINVVFLMTMAFQYLYGLSVLQTALIMVPAQAGAILGTRFIAGPLMRRIGVTRTAAWLFAVLAVAMLLSFAVTVSSPLWVPAAYVAIYNILTVAASITVTSGLMSTASDEDSGEVAAYRGSGVSIGAVLAVVIMNSAVFGLGRLFMMNDFEASGMSASQASDMMTQIQDSSTSVDVMSQYSMPLPDGVPVDSVMQETIAVALHANGVLGSLLAIACVLLVVGSARVRSRKRSRKAEVPVS